MVSGAPVTAEITMVVTEEVAVSRVVSDYGWQLQPYPQVSNLIQPNQVGLPTQSAAARVGCGVERVNLRVGIVRVETQSYPTNPVESKPYPTLLIATPISDESMIERLLYVVHRGEALLDIGERKLLIFEIFGDGKMG
ncbi:hypothetical protein PIB30_073848 [Stylosanthes scabra]|uniref:Uncharacterized protein n=1 Tax=Stylosanthes scabra TaxID=79078 RepID=A0ABU6XME1_9FABA|nr:hypothetical protein [Stylosanthes scabra]